MAFLIKVTSAQHPLNYYQEQYELDNLAISIEELNWKCHLIFKHREREQDRQRKQRRRASAARTSLARSATLIRGETSDGDCSTKPPLQQQQPKRRRRETTSRLPKTSDKYVKLLGQVLQPIYRSKWDEVNQTTCVLRLDFTWGTDWLHIERGLIHLLSAAGCHQAVITAIGKIGDRFQRWPLPLHKEINDLWYNSLYYIVPTSKSPDQMTPVNTFRIRKKNPCPIENLVGSSKYNIPERANERLKQFYSKDPRPNKEEKRRLCDETGLSFETVANWFKNRRQRELRAIKAEPSESTAYYTPPKVRPDGETGERELVGGASSWSSNGWESSTLVGLGGESRIPSQHSSNQNTQAPMSPHEILSFKYIEHEDYNYYKQQAPQTTEQWHMTTTATCYPGDVVAMHQPVIESPACENYMCTCQYAFNVVPAYLKG